MAILETSSSDHSSLDRSFSLRPDKPGFEDVIAELKVSQDSKTVLIKLAPQCTACLEQNALAQDALKQVFSRLACKSDLIVDLNQAPLSDSIVAAVMSAVSSSLKKLLSKSKTF